MPKRRTTHEYEFSLLDFSVLASPEPGARAVLTVYNPDLALQRGKSDDCGVLRAYVNPRLPRLQAQRRPRGHVEHQLQVRVGLQPGGQRASIQIRHDTQTPGIGWVFRLHKKTVCGMRPGRPKQRVGLGATCKAPTRRPYNACPATPCKEPPRASVGFSVSETVGGTRAPVMALPTPYHGRFIDAASIGPYLVRGVAYFQREHVQHGATGSVRFTWRSSKESSGSGSVRPRAIFAAVAIILLTASTGCSTRLATFEIIDYPKPGEERRYRETFDEAFYSLDGHGNVDVVLRSLTDGGSDPSGAVTQIIHIHGFWRSIPGSTVAHSTQLNATVAYHILTGRVGATFEGAGSVFFKHDHRNGVLVGKLDLATLQPKRRLAGGSPLFQRATLRGRFHAEHDPRRVVQIVNEMNRRFTPTG